MIKIDASVARQIREIYGQANRTIYAYGKEGDKQYQYTVPFPGALVPELHPVQRDYKLLGVVDLETGTIRPVGRSGSTVSQPEGRDDTEKVTVGEIIHVVALIGGWLLKLLGLAILGIIAVAELCTRGNRR